MLRALLIDDEAAARTDLRAKLAAHTGVTVVGEAATLRAARALLASADYDVVFLDVQLIGGESFLLLPGVRAGASVVFATAYDRYAARAFESNAIDYLIKPIDSARLAEALRRAARAHAAGATRHDRVGGDSTEAVRTPVAAVPARATPESLDEVALTDDERVFLRHCLEAWENSLAPAHVLRAHAVRLARTIRYARDQEPTRMFLAGAPASSRVRRWWRTLRARFGP
ncbi:MAG: response regulator [Verrucomicrobia bacterium]|nr:response regulator [Verrucomicrobiota bacterium]